MLARQIVIGLGIALIFPMLVYFGISAVTPPPHYQDYYTFRVAPAPTAAKEERQAYEDQRQNQLRSFQFARAQFAQKLIVVMAPLGIAAILGGYFLGVNAIGTGFMLGGILCVVYGYAGYWAYLYPWMRFFSLLSGMLMLLFVGFKHLGLPFRASEAPRQQ
jgi:hypothetical protein